MSVTVGCDTVLTVDTKLPPSCNFLVSESFKIAIEVYNRWRISLKRLESPSLITDRHLTCQQAVNAGYGRRIITTLARLLIAYS
ncbi:hypothetical protein YC2023_025448 [Brassica napus]